MRFSCHQQFPPSSPAHERGRRRAKFVGKVKAEIRQAANAQGMSITRIAKILGCNKSVISRALDSDSNIELLTMFDLAEAVGSEWKVSLGSREQDLGEVFPGISPLEDLVKTSSAPLTSKAARTLSVQPQRTQYVFEPADEVL